MVQQTCDNKFGVAKWIVDATASLGTHTTIAAALTSASSGDTIFIRPGTYTENLTLKAGVNLTAFGSDSSVNTTGKVIISGIATLTTAGTVTIYGIQLQTNSNFFLAITGSAASVVNLRNCYLNCLNNTGISFTSSSASAELNIYGCESDLVIPAIALFTDSSVGTLYIFNSNLGNSGASTTASLKSAGNGTFYYVYSKIPIATSGVSKIGMVHCSFDTAGANAMCYLAEGTLQTNILNSSFSSGTATTISVGAGLNLNLVNCSVNSENAVAITGAGTLGYSPIAFQNITVVNTTTQTPILTGPSATFGSTNSGATNTLKVTNLSNTASSRANVTASVGGTSSEDGSFSSVITGGQTWSWGGDNSASDAFVISANAALGTTDVMSVATTGEINFPLQSAFLAYLSASVTNVTGDGTAYTIVFNTEVYDQNSDFNTTTGVFTAPVTGKYTFHSNPVILQIGAGHTSMQQNIVSSNTTIRSYLMNPAPIVTSTNLGLTNAATVDMDAADTCSIQVLISGSTLTCDVDGGAAAGGTYFSGSLIC